MNLTLTTKTLLTTLLAFGLSIAFTVPVDAQQNVVKVWCHDAEFDVHNETGYTVQNGNSFFYLDERRCTNGNKISEEVAVKNTAEIIKLIITTNFLHPILNC